MSTYCTLVKHPVTNRYKLATCIDDYFGAHHYGVQFEGEEMVYDDWLCDMPRKKVKTKADIKLITDYFNNQFGK